MATKTRKRKLNQARLRQKMAKDRAREIRRMAIEDEAAGAQSVSTFRRGIFAFIRIWLGGRK